MYKSKEEVIKDYLINGAHQLLLNGRKRKITAFFAKYDLSEAEIEFYTNEATQLFEKSTKYKIRISEMWVGIKEILLVLIFLAGVFQGVDFLIDLMGEFARIVNGIN